MADRKRKTGQSAGDPKSDESMEGRTPHALNKIVKVLGMARNASGERLGIAVQPRGQPARVHVLDIRLTAPQGTAGLIDWALKTELDGLLDVGTKSLGAAMRDAAAGKAVVVLDQPGYHRLMVGDVPLAAYAWGGRVYFLGREPDVKVLVTGVAANPVARQGTWEEWIEAIQPIAKVNPRLLVCLCVSLSAAILRAFGVPSFTLALWAPTTKGKTTCQLVCSAMTGLPKVMQWNGTPIGVQEFFADRPDQPACIDDAHKARKGDDVAQLVMAAGNGSGRLVSKRSSGSEPPREIHSLPIFSTEKQLAAMLGNTAASGMFARSFEIGEGKAESAHGMFDNLGDHDGGASLSKHLKRVVKDQYGTIWPRWLKLLSKRWPKVQRLHSEKMPELRAAILKAALEPSLDPITDRVLDNLSFAAFAGVVATELGLWSIPTRRINSAFGLLLKEHLDRTPKGNSLAARFVEAVAGYIDTHRHMFPPVSRANDPDLSGHVGYLIEHDEHGPLYAFLPAVFRELFVKKFGDEIYEALRATGNLVCHGSRHNRFTKRVAAGPDSKKKPMDFVAVKASIRYAPAPA